MVKYAQLPIDFQKTFAVNAGMILSDFNPQNPGSAEAIKASVLYATTGGVKVSCAAVYKDWGEDINNCPKMAKELNTVNSWECRLSGTALTITAENSILPFGAADRSAEEDDATLISIKPRMSVKTDDFKTLWYVCPYGTEGGFLAVKLENALNIGGFSLKASDRAKGQFAFEYVGYTSIDAPCNVPFTFYLKKSDGSAVQTVNATEQERSALCS